MSTIMVDTIHFSVLFDFPVFLGDSFGWKLGGKITQGWKVFGKEIRKTKYVGGAKVTVKFLEENYQNKSQMNIYVSSLPKVYSDNNFEKSTRFPQDFLQLAEMIQSTFQIPKFDVLKANVFRLDPSTVFSVGDLVQTYLDVIRQLHHPSRDRRTYCNSIRNYENGVEFFTAKGLVATKFYDKYLESLDHRAKGLLRYEVSINGADNLRNYTGISTLHVGDITHELLLKILNSEIAMIRLHKSHKHYKYLAESLLKKEYKKQDDVIQYLAIYKYLCEHWGDTDGQLSSYLGRDQKTIRKRRDKVISLGGPFLKFGKGINELPGLWVE